MRAAPAALAAAAFLLAHAQTPPATLSVVVNVTVPQSRLAAPYLNFNLDIGSIYNGFDWRDPVLINLVYPLSNDGVIIRVGGTAADYAFYQPAAASPQGAAAGETLYSAALLDDLFYFAAQTGANLLFDFNGLAFRPVPNADGTLGPWDPTGNATAMLGYLNAKYGGAVRWSWSLGNEPDLWTEKVNMTTLGHDALALGKVLAGYRLGTDVYGPSLSGLAVAPVQEFLQATGGNVAGVTVHNYPLGRDCNVSAYLDRSVVDRLGGELAALVAARDAMGHRNTPLVLEEVAGCYGGGCENITDRFVDGFFYLSMLGAVAASGFSRVHRQDVAGWSFTGGKSHYQLAGPPGWTNGSTLLTPHPDWYTSVLFKQLIANTLLNTTVTGDAAALAQVSVHAWCSGAAWWDDESMVLSWTNPTGADVTLDVVIPDTPAAPRMEFTLTSSAAGYSESHARVAAGRAATMASPLAPPASLTDDALFLNGARLQADENGVLPWVNGAVGAGRVVTDPSEPIIMPPFSYGFIQLPGSAPHAC